MQPLITFSGVSFELPNARLLFKHLNLSLNSNLTALVGPNGIGKTTLAKLISGELEATTGTIRQRAPVFFFSQRETPKEIPVYEYLAKNYTWSLVGEKLLEDINRETLCSNLSGGQWMRVRLANLQDDLFLVMDEPTNDLDRSGKEALFSFLREYKYGALIISHDRECLELCQDILELSNQGLAKYGGGWSAYEETKEQERNHLLSTLHRAKRDRDDAHEDRIALIQKQEKKNRRGSESAAKGGIPRILLGGRKSRAQETSGKMSSSTLERSQDKVREAHEAYEVLKIDPIMYADLVGAAIPNQKLVAEAKDFNIKFDNWIYPQDLNFTWRGNIRLAIKGNNGSGKSTLLKAILGDISEHRGELKRGELHILYLDQQCSILDDSKNIFENVRLNSKLSDKDLRNGLAKLLFTGESVFQRVSTLSGGERLRAALACGLLNEKVPELLILDEPTNNLDLGNINFLEGLVSQFKGALIIISHDVFFLDKCGVEEELIL